MSERKLKRGRGRPPKYVLDPIDAPAAEVARALFRSADRKRKASQKPPDDEPARV